MSKNTNLRKITNHLSADNNVLSSNVSQTITGSLTVTGNLTAQQFILSSSVTYLTESFASGSHKFGDSSDDIHTFTGSLVVSGSANPLRVGSNLLFVSSSGNVGIGTSSPDRPLDIYSSTVLGIARIRGNNSNGVALTIQNDENAQGISIYAAGTSGFGLNGWAGNTALESETGFVYSAFNGNHIFQNGNRAERMRITSTGNVVINASGTPSLTTGQLVNRQKSDSTTPYLNGIVNMAQANSSTLTIYYDGSVHNIAASYYTGGDGGAYKPIVFSTGDVERVRITSGGYLKASNDGTYVSSTGAYHELRNSANQPAVFITNTKSSGTEEIIRIKYTAFSPNGNTNWFLYADDSTAARFYVTSNGGIGNYQGNNTNLSDERTKKDIIPLESYWNKFKDIEIVKFKYKDQTHDDFNIGVISQQVEQVAPEFVDIDGFGQTPEDGVPLKSIYTTDLYHTTIKVLQEAMTKIEELKTENDTLKEILQRNNIV
jgi:hypothetical protein